MDFAKDELQPFNPQDPSYQWRLWVRVIYPDGSRWYFFWRRIATATAVAMVAVWFLLAGGAWGFLKYARQWDEASYGDLLLYPFTKDRVRSELATHNLTVGQIEIEKKNYRYGYALLASGLRWRPEDLRARRTLAITDVRFRNIPRALNTLADGVRYNPDLEYYKLLFGWLLEAQQDERVLALARQLLPATPTQDLTQQFIALQAGVAHFERGRYDEAETLGTSWGLEKSVEGLVLLARCDWERGFRERALLRLQAEFDRFANRDELYLHLIQFLRDLGNEAEARRMALLRQFKDPSSPGPRVDLLYSYRATGDYVAEGREVAAFLEEFGGDEKALQLLASYAVGTLQEPLLADICARVLAQGFRREECEVARIQLALIDRRFRDVIAICDAAGQSKIGTDWRFAAFKAVALFALSDTNAASALKTAVGPLLLRMADALTLSRHLRMVGQRASARWVLEHCHNHDPLAQPAVAEIIRLDAETDYHDGLVDYLPKYLAMRNPARPVLEEALLALDVVRDAALVAQVRSALARIHKLETVVQSGPDEVGPRSPAGAIPAATKGE